MKNKFIAYLFLIVISGTLYGSGDYWVWVEFTDKNHSPYTINNPSEFLTKRALDRRFRQNIPIDFSDLPVSPAYLDSLRQLKDANIYYTSRWFNGALLHIKNAQAREVIYDYTFVSSAEFVKEKPVKTYFDKGNENDSLSYRPGGYAMDLQNHFQLNDLELFPYSSTSGFSDYPSYGAAENQIQLVNGQELHKRGYWGREKVIAVLDAGYRGVDSLNAFRYLWDQKKILGYRDFVELGDSEIFRAHGHGTFVLSVMGAYEPGLFAGAALGASYWLLRTEDARSEFRIEEYNWLAGAEFADSVGADIINSSLGYTTFDDPLQNYTYADLDGYTTVVAKAADKAFRKGILVVNSAGNYGAQNWKYIGSPADSPAVLAVGGTNSEGERVSFSSIGPTADGRIKPDVMAQAQGVAVLNLMNSVGQANGTSFSAPLISALSACLWQQNSGASNQDIKNAIVQSADRFLYPDYQYGYGVPDFNKASQILSGSMPIAQYVTLLKNPIVTESVLKVFSENQKNISIDFYASNGQKLWSVNNISLLPGFNEIKPFSDINQIASGVYFIKINFPEHSELLRALKL